MAMDSARVRVAVRVRLPSEAASGVSLRENYICLSSSSARDEDKEIEYDAVFGPDASTTALAPFTVSPLVNSLFDGISGAIMCYGQSGSGKTFTIEGSDGSGGLASQAFKMIFERVKDLRLRGGLLGPNRTQVHVRASYVQIYMERVYDLLVDGPTEPNKASLRVFHDDRDVRLTEATSVRIVDSNEALSLLLKG